MACNEIIYKGSKYSEEQFLEMLNSGKVIELGELLKAKELTNDLQEPHYENFSHIQDFVDRYKAISDRKQELQQQGAQISRLTDKGFSWIIPEGKEQFYQSEGITSSKASLETVDKVTQKLSNLGVDWKVISKDLYTAEGNPADTNEMIDVGAKLARVVLGHEQTSIPEMGMHMAFRIIQQTNPKLAKEMLNRIDRYDIYQQVVGRYKDFKQFQTADGKPNIPKLKEEAVGKVLAEYYIQHEEGSTEKPELLQQAQTWWQKIKDYLKSLFGIGNPFEQVAKQFANDKLTEVRSTDSKDFEETETSNIRKGSGTGKENERGHKDTFYSEENQQRVRSTLKSVDIARTPKAVEQWGKLKRHRITLNQFLENSQFPKEQKQLLQDIYEQEQPKELSDLITSLVVKYSYTVEISTAKTVQETGSNFREELTNKLVQEGYPENSVEFDKEWSKRITEEQNRRDRVNSDHYSNLTVPGGTNYTENEIATPGIIPSIKGHAQFSTDNGIGWFRSDDRESVFAEVPTGKKVYNGTIDGKDVFVDDTMSVFDRTKVRRILEVQSDLFQKGRDKEQLSSKVSINTYNGAKNEQWVDYNGRTNRWEAHNERIGVLDSFNTEKEANAFLGIAEDSGNDFLQLLNKDGNWINFFVKAIVQDSAKKGYEKVLFPTGDTASKVEGHETIEQFRKQKEDRINLLKDEKAKLDKWVLGTIDKTGYSGELKDTKEEVIDELQQSKNPFKKENPQLFIPQQLWEYKGKPETFDKEIAQLQEELKRVESEGFAALKPIYNFYEVRVKNILDKTYGKDQVRRITDEHSNHWYQVAIDQKRDSSEIFYQASEPDKGKVLFDRIQDQAKNMSKVTNAEGDTEHRVKDPATGKEWKPEFRGSDKGKAVYEKRLGTRFEGNRDPKKEKADKDNGTLFHGYIEDINNRYLDPVTGFKRDIPQAKVGDRDGIYNSLERYMGKVYDQFPADTRFMWEIPVYMKGKKPGDGDIASTIDFMAITPDGAVYKKDWKFMADKTKEDISNITQEAHQAQMGIYGTILRRAYGIEQIKESNTVPFKMVYGKDDKKYEVQSVTIADANYADINDRTLLPVVSEQVQLSVGDKEDPKVTALLQNLFKLKQTIGDAKVKPAQKRVQEKQVQDINYAIRSLVLKKDLTELTNIALNTVNTHMRSLVEVEKFVNDSSKVSDISAEDAGRLIEHVLDAEESAEIFGNLRETLNEFTADMDKGAKKALDEALDKINARVNRSKNMLFDKNTGHGILQKLGIKIGDVYGIYNLMSKERPMRGDQALFNAGSSAPFKTAQLWFSVRDQAESRIQMKIADETTKLGVIDKKVTEWMGSTWDKNRLNDLLFKKTDKGKWKPLLVNKVATEFYDELAKKQELAQSTDEAIRTKGRQWIKDNIDIDRYKEDYKKIYEGFEKWATDNSFDPATYVEAIDDRKGTLDEEIRQKAIENFKNRYDIDRPSAFNLKNDRLRSYANDSNWSEQYKQIRQKGNEPIAELYDHIVTLNKRAHEAGMLGNYYYHFFPQVRRSTLDLLFDGGTAKSLWRSLLSPFITEAGDNGYRNPMTGQLEHIVHGQFMHDLAINGDYEQVSDDVMKALTLFTGEVIAYEEKTDIEGIAKALIAIQKNKKTAVYERGKLVLDHIGKPLGTYDDQMLKWLEDDVNAHLYGVKVKGEDKGINMKINGQEVYMSRAKTMSSLTRGFSLKALGLNPASAMANLFGGAANAYINSGNHFTKTELTRAYKHVLDAKFSTEEGAKFVALLDHFVPFTEDVIRHKAKELTKKQYLNYLSGEGLMVLLRSSDNVVQMANASVYFQNTMVENGRLVNIREFVKDKYDYKNIYNKSEAEIGQIRELIDKDITELQRTRNLFNDPSIKFDKEGLGVQLGVERLSDSEVSLRQRVQQLTRDTVGNRTPDEMAHLNMLWYGTALMAFRNWIPRLVQKRYGRFRYSAGAETYEIGRMRMVGDILRDDVNSRVSNLINLLSFTHLGTGETTLADIVKRQYQRRVNEQRQLEEVYEGSMFEKTVTEAQFVDQYLNGVRAQVKELELTVALMSAFFLSLSWAQSLTKDDDYPYRGFAKWSTRMLDKFSDELGFFYSPESFKKIVGSGNAVPMFTVLNDIAMFTTKLTKEGFYQLTEDEEGSKNNKVLRYPISYIPAINQFSSYFSMFNEDWADVMGYKQNYRYGLFNK